MSTGSCPYGGNWYSCTDQNPYFQGCCLSDPCEAQIPGCPDDQFFPSAFATATAAAGSSTSASSTSTSSSTTSSSITSSSSGPSITAPPAKNASLSNSSSTSPSPSLSRGQVQAIVGGTAAGAVCVFLLFALLWTWYRAKRSRKLHISQPPQRSPPSPSPCPSSPFPEISEYRPIVRNPLPYIQTSLEKTRTRASTVSTYSAYSPVHVAPSCYESQVSATDSLLGRQHARSLSSNDAYYPGRPIFGIPHAIKTPEVVQPTIRRISLEAETSAPSLYMSHRYTPNSSASVSRMSSNISSQHSPTLPAIIPWTSFVSPQTSPSIPSTSRPVSRRASSNFSYPMPHVDAATATATPPLDVVPLPLKIKAPVEAGQADRGLGTYDPRRRSAPAIQPIYETDPVPDLPEPRSRVESRWMGPNPGFNLRTRIEGRASWGVGGKTASETVESINTSDVGKGWGGDMRTNRERERDALREREQEREVKRRMMMEGLGMSFASWQALET